MQSIYIQPRLQLHLYGEWRQKTKIHMRRVRFQEFSQLPDDVQLMVLDYVLNRHDPFGFNDSKRCDCGTTKASWCELRLVCHKWSQWFSLASIRYFAAAIHGSSSNHLLKSMKNLKTLDVRGALSLKHLVSILPPTIQKLICPLMLLQYLPRKQSLSLRSVVVECDVTKPRSAPIFRQIIDDFGLRLQHVSLLYDFKNISDRLIDGLSGWQTALVESRITELTISVKGDLNSDFLPILPATLRQLHVKGLFECSMTWLAPAASNLELIDASKCILNISLDAPVLSALMHLKVCEIYALDDEFYEENILHKYLPRLEELYLICSDMFFSPPGLGSMTSLRGLHILSLDSSEPFFLSLLSPSLVEFEFDCDEYGRVEGMPPYMPNLRRLALCVSDGVPREIFSQLPAVQELVVDIKDDNGINIEDLLPVRETLVNLDLTASEVAVLDRFSKLRKLQIFMERDKTLATLGRLSPSIEELGVFGDFADCEPMDPLPNLISLSAHISPEPLTEILRNAPNIQFMELWTCTDAFWKVLNDLDGCLFKCLGTFKITISSLAPILPIFSIISLLLAKCPSMKYLEIDGFLGKINGSDLLPMQMLTLISEGALGLELACVVVTNSDLNLSVLSEKQHTAIFELKSLGVEFIIKNLNY